VASCAAERRQQVRIMKSPGLCGLASLIQKLMTLVAGLPDL
jgi:hypothetical protein